MTKIRAISKRVGEPPRTVWISDTLENLQKHVGGYIETWSFASDAAIVCNEEGGIRGLPYNCMICGMPFYGDILIVGTHRDRFIGLNYSFIPNIKESIQW